jgi:DNA-binding NtrC family response regulator
MPSLRERREDIPLLVDAFIQEFAEANKKPVKKISPEALSDLLAYDWPGNIRELRNVIERITVMVEEPLVRPEHIPPEVGGRGAGGAPERGLVVPLGTSLKKVEEAVIRRTLESFSGHREKAARALGISPRALQYKIARYGLARKRRAKSSRA